MGELFSWQLVWDSFPLILPYLPVTLGIAVVSMFMGLILGLICALIRIYQVPVAKNIAAFYISFMRGTPLLVQLYLAYYGLPLLIQIFADKVGWQINIHEVPALFFVFLTFSLNVGAYLSETIRAAIASVAKVQLEAAYSIGMTTFQAMRRIVLPQAFLIALPNMGNLFISLIKDTSLAFMITVVEIMGQAKIIGGRHLHYFEVYLAAAVIYWVCCIVIEKALAYLERRLRAKTGVLA